METKGLLYHFSEDPTIETFIPRLSPANQQLPPVVWAIDHEHAPLYYFPRECPRAAFWSGTDTTREDCDRFLLHTRARMVIAVEGAWIQRVQKTRLFVYQFTEDSFQCIDKGAGYFVSEKIVVPVGVEPMDDLLYRLYEANVELRITPSLFPLSTALVQSTLQYSMIRMRNATEIPM